jgi:hypothetical protein
METINESEKKTVKKAAKKRSTNRRNPGKKQPEKKEQKKPNSITPPRPKFKLKKDGDLFRPKFLHLAHHIHDQLLRAPILIGGFYNWHRVVSGEFDLLSHKRGKLKEYDIIFLGLSRPEMEGLMISRIREEIGENSNTLIVVCVDYAIEIWHQTFNMHALELELKKADIIFTGEPMMKNQLEALTGMPIELVPHPTNTRVVKQFGIPIEQRQPAIVCLIHRYNNDWIPPYLVVKDFKDIHNYAIMLDGSQQNIITKMPFFQFVRPGVDYEPWINFVKQAKIVLDSYHNMHTYGRNVVDCACLKVPVVGTDQVYAQPILFPDLTTKPNDILEQRKLVARLKSDLDFYKKVTDYAFEKVDDFGYDASSQRFEKIVKDYKANVTPGSKK